MPLLLAIATAFGLIHLWLAIPFGVMRASDPLWRIPFNDVAMNVLGAEAFLRDPSWHFPLASTSRLLSGGEPVSIVYTDSAPWIAIILKALGVAPDQVSVMGVTAALAFILQPVAFALFLRALGVRRPEVLLIGTLLGALLPAWYWRLTWHIALASHWLIVLALASAATAIRKGVSWGVIAGLAALGAFSIGIHPYLFVMVAAVAGGALLSDVARLGRAAVPKAFAGIGLFAACSALSAWLLISGAGEGVGGFGRFSMNLLSPFFPQRSGLTLALLGHSGRFLDATGGQYEGFNYLGAGVLLCGLLAVVLLVRRVPPFSAWRPAIPLIAALVGLTALALSNRVFIGHFAVLDIPVGDGAMSWLNVVRSSGRMFWPVAYAGLGWAMLMLDRSPQRILAGVALGAALLLQIVETSVVRDELGDAFRPNTRAAFDASHWRAGGRFVGRDLRFVPAYLCTVHDHEVARQAALATHRSGGAVHNGPLARFDPQLCSDEALSRALADESPGDVDLLMIRSLPPQVIEQAKRSRQCVEIDQALLCT